MKFQSSLFCLTLLIIFKIQKINLVEFTNDSFKSKSLNSYSNSLEQLHPSDYKYTDNIHQLNENTNNSKFNSKMKIMNLNKGINFNTNQPANRIKFPIEKEKYHNPGDENNGNTNSNLPSPVSPTLQKYFAKQILFSSGSSNNYFNKVRITCNIYNCKPMYGTCDNNGKYCSCLPGYVHAPKLFSKKHICRYRQYTWLTCLILELLLPGLGILYFRDMYEGLLKILLIPIVYYYWGESKGIKLVGLSLVGYFLIFLHLKDLSMLIANNLTDRYGIYPL